MAKGLASSYEPLSATVVKQEIFDCFLNDPSDQKTRLNYFRDISTYGGCAGPMAAALESTRIIDEEKLVENSRVVGAYLLEKLTELRDYPIVGDVRGVGLFCGVEFVRNKETKEPVSESEMATLVGHMMAQNIIVGRTNSSITGLNTVMNFAPCLIITREQVDRVVAGVKTAIEKGF